VNPDQDDLLTAEAPTPTPAAPTAEVSTPTAAAPAPEEKQPPRVRFACGPL
jgi:hypothetical protein